MNIVERGENINLLEYKNWKYEIINLYDLKFEDGWMGKKMGKVGGEQNGWWSRKKFVVVVC